MNGSASNSVTKIAMIFGTNTSVCSWICVSAWNSDTTTPTTRPTTISGDDTTTMVQMASRATSSVSAPVMSHLPSRDRHRCCVAANDLQPRIPAIRSLRPIDLTSRGMRAKWLVGFDGVLDRHLHDVFIGLDDAIAHRDQRRHGDVGFRNRCDHVHHV